MPPFRASQLIYSEFPEDKGRSLYNEIERKDTRAGYRATKYGYEVRDSKHEASNRYKDYIKSREELTSDESLSAQESMEYLKYNNFQDYKGEKNDIDDFTLESFELDPEVMKPPPPMEETENTGAEEDDTGEKKKDEPVGRASRLDTSSEDMSDVSNSTESESNEVSTDPPVLTTQLEVPVTQSPLIRTTSVQVTMIPVAVPRRPIASYRSAGNLQLIAKPMYTTKWRTVLSPRQLSALQMMKPPPLAQSWRKKLKVRSRPTIIYL
ncbi:hypothetical protein O3M35_002428 [Rhynocoris fuscipes]|uniref:Uncharacterized protein n=1 Tax=Rhynocoris fuscipes TaxID=488301 RepID=A0AAW1CLR8_9HEMI